MVPEQHLWPEPKTRIQACYQVPSRPIARDLVAGIVADFAVALPTAVDGDKAGSTLRTAHVNMILDRMAGCPWLAPSDEVANSDLQVPEIPGLDGQTGGGTGTVVKSSLRGISEA
jgi:hypothetical protein